jgi:hypothetical protein
MRSQIAFKHLLMTTFATLVLAGVANRAWADDKTECSASYDQTQSLRHDGKLQAARQQAVSCAREACAEFIRTDCAKWLGEIDSSQPTVVFEVHDAQAHDVRSVQVSLDGKPWLDKVDGGAKAIDPGQHKLHYVIDGQPPIDDTVEIREGEKNRKLTASFQDPRASDRQMLPEKTTPPETPPPDAAPSRSIGPWVVGGIGVAGLAVFAITGGIALSDLKTPTGCTASGAAHTCANAADTAKANRASSQGKTLGTVSTVALAAGAVGVVTSIVWLVARPHGKATSARLSFGQGPGDAGLGVEGKW